MTCGIELASMEYLSALMSQSLRRAGGAYQQCQQTQECTVTMAVMTYQLTKMRTWLAPVRARLVKLVSLYNGCQRGEYSHRCSDGCSHMQEGETMVITQFLAVAAIVDLPVV
jgi:hypothetical protein